MERDPLSAKNQTL